MFSAVKSERLKVQYCTSDFHCNDCSFFVLVMCTGHAWPSEKESGFNHCGMQFVNLSHHGCAIIIITGLWHRLQCLANPPNGHTVCPMVRCNVDRREAFLLAQWPKGVTEGK